MKAYLLNKEHDVSMPPPESRWSRPPVRKNEEGRIFYATSNGGVFYFRNLTGKQKVDWDTFNRHNNSPNEMEIANELRYKER